MTCSKPNHVILYLVSSVKKSVVQKQDRFQNLTENALATVSFGAKLN